ncbi:MAG: AAA family ATPase [Erysipelotrichaceae bacterium]
MTVIHIYGASGSGTSTLGKVLQTQYGFNFLDTDDYFWELTDPPFTTKRLVEDRIKLLKKDIIQSNDVVICGSLCGWGDEFIPYFDIVIRLVSSTEMRIKRIEKREFQRFGARILEGGDMYEEHIKFIKWASEYDNGDSSMRSKVMHDEWQKLLECKHITLNSNQPIEKLIEEIFTKIE